MLQRDYLLEIIAQFVEMVTRALRAARAAADPAAAIDAAQAAEAEVASLIDMDPAVALSLEPESLATMVGLSGMGESLAGYVAFTLDRVGDIYSRAGDDPTADLRYAQAEAIATIYACDLDTPPVELVELAGELDA